MRFFLSKSIIFLYFLFFISKSFAQYSPSLNKTFHSNDDIIFQNKNDKIGYALGVSLGNYVNQSFEKQKKIGINLNKKYLLLGIQDAISENLKLSHEEISNILHQLENKLKKAEREQREMNEKENFIQGELYMKNISKMKGVNKTKSGLLYLIKSIGNGETITNNSKITVHYKGSLINGVEFDNSYKRGHPITLLLKDVILGWQEGLKYIKKGGKIQLIIPPNLAYGSNEINGIPGNSTLIFDIELLDVK